MGSNILAGIGRENILIAYHQSIEKKNNNKIPPLWDGNTAELIWQTILDY